MRVVLSRKGVDSTAGACASVIHDGRCLSLPIPVPDAYPSRLRYRDMGLPLPVEDLSGGALGSDRLCHPDPAFHGGMAVLGQVDAAQSHLENQQVGPGDVFLFFGLFREGQRKTHRIFGYLKVHEVRRLGRRPKPDTLIGLPWAHPHTEGDIAHWPENNTVYIGAGATNAPAHDALRLTHPQGALTRWQVPEWLARCGLSYHANPSRWSVPGELSAVSRGQEFVAPIGTDTAAKDWLDHTISLIRH